MAWGFGENYELISMNNIFIGMRPFGQSRNNKISRAWYIRFFTNCIIARFKFSPVRPKSRIPFMLNFDYLSQIPSFVSFSLLHLQDPPPPKNDNIISS